MIGPRRVLLALAAIGLGGSATALLPEPADTPTSEAADRLAMVDLDEKLPAPVPPAPVARVTGHLNNLDVSADGILTLSGLTERDGSPADVPISVWIDNAPADVFEPEPAAATDIEPGQEEPDDSGEPADTAPPELSTEPAEAEVEIAGAFKAAVKLREGPQEVCAIADNDAGPDGLLGCEEVMYRAPLLEGRMIVADYGSGATPRLGIAGEGTPQEAAARVAARANEWEEITGIPTIPAFDYIQTVAQASPGSDGDYSAHTSREDLEEYLAAIREVDGMLILDFQPGGGRFMKQVSQYEEYLIQPDVGLALDTEWRMPWGVAPATIIGYADASEINEVGEYLAGLVAEHNLPQKPFVVHQFTRRMVRNREAIEVRPELATIFHIDGHGGKTLKKGVYKSLLPREEHYTGFKLFFDEDTGLMTPLEVRDELARIPSMVSYQ
ncbi:MAG: hypothetical protein HKN24_04335 [Acidimicrobiales bacterium]|nr:hypothetical protein [Acidimicrobiales bacterium]